MNNFLLRTISTLILAVGCYHTNVYADNTYADNTVSNNSTEFGELVVHHSLFSSTSLQPEIASRYGLIRGKDYVLINIAVVPKTTPGKAIPAKVSGTATNLMQQRKALDFKPIAEKDTTYYIAALRTSNEEFFHFDIEVTPEGSQSPLQLKFTKQLYVNE